MLDNLNQKGDARASPTQLRQSGNPDKEGNNYADYLNRVEDPDKEGNDRTDKEERHGK